MDPLIRVCSLLNAAGARYLIAGAQACILTGMIRTTKAVDVLIEPSKDNGRRGLEGLAGMEDDWARELTPQDWIDNVAVKIDGVRIPYLGLDKLIESKSTYREPDRLDVLRLMDLKARKEREDR